MSDSLPAPGRGIRERMFDPVPSAIVVWVRIAVGITIYFWAGSFLKVVPYQADGIEKTIPLYEAVFLEPEFLFKYWGLEWVRLWPGKGIYWHFVVTQVAAICLAIGLLTRVSAAIVCGAIAYVLLVERQIYVNHYYLLSCAAGLLVFLPAGRSFAVDAAIGIEPRQQIMPRWQLWLLRFQLGMPYIFGAIAKLNSDWLAGQPAGIILSNRAEMPIVGPYLMMPGAKEVIAYGGLFYDLLIVPMLLYRRTRWLGVALSLVFHLTNSQLLSIGVFPWFMLATLIVFFPADAIPNLVARFGRRAKPQPTSGEDLSSTADESVKPTSRLGKLGLGLAILYVVIQLLLPIRPWVLPGNPSWNERGQRFAWRMMLRDKNTLTAYLIRHEPSGQFLYAPSTVVMTYYQASRAERDPELVRQAAVQLRRKIASLGLPNSRIHALQLVSLNGRRPTPIIDPTIDLASAQRGWFSDDWVIEDPGPFRDQVWAVDKEQWWKSLELPDPFKPLGQTTPSELLKYVESIGEAAPAGNQKTSP